MRTTTMILLALVAASLFLVVPGYGYPTSLNNVPTAETVGGGDLLFEVCNYGSSAMWTTESTMGVLTQFGLGDRLEFGADRYENEEYSETYLNGKFKLLPERGLVPALAVGVMDVARSGKPTVYSVASKWIGDVGLHAGFLRGSYAHGVMAGAEYDITDKLWFGADYLPGEANHLRLGVSYSLTSASSVLFSLGVPHDREYAKTELMLTFSTVVGLTR